MASFLFFINMILFSKKNNLFSITNLPHGGLVVYPIHMKFPWTYVTPCGKLVSTCWPWHHVEVMSYFGHLNAGHAPGYDNKWKSCGTLVIHMLATPPGMTSYENHVVIWSSTCWKNLHQGHEKANFSFCFGMLKSLLVISLIPTCFPHGPMLWHFDSNHVDDHFTTWFPHGKRGVATPPSYPTWFPQESSKIKYEFCCLLKNKIKYKVLLSP